MEQPEDLQPPEDLPPALHEPIQVWSGVAGAGGPDDPDPTEDDERMFLEQERRAQVHLQQRNSVP